MTEHEILIESLREIICGNSNIDSDKKNSLSSKQLYSLYKIAKSQDLSHIVGSSLQEYLNENTPQIRQLFTRDQQLALYRYVKLEYESKQIYEVFERNSIKYMPLKGSIIRSYYPLPEMRTSCDIDILIFPDDLDKAINCLVSEINYTTERRYSHDVSLYSESKVHLELHFNLIEDNERVSKILSGIWETSTLDNNSNYRYIMSNEFFVVYHIAHMAEHFINGGCGIRNFLDLWVAKNKMRFDKSITKDLLLSCGLYEFSSAVFHLSNVWFGYDEHNDVTREIESYVFGSGIYGTIENRVAILHANNNGKLRYIYRRLFLPYSKLKNIYPMLENYPVLLPYYQVVRWVDFILNKDKKHTLLELKFNNNMVQEKKNSLKSLMNKLNLLK